MEYSRCGRGWRTLGAAGRQGIILFPGGGVQGELKFAWGTLLHGRSGWISAKNSQLSKFQRFPEFSQILSSPALPTPRNPDFTRFGTSSRTWLHSATHAAKHPTSFRHHHVNLRPEVPGLPRGIFLPSCLGASSERTSLTQEPWPGGRTSTLSPGFFVILVFRLRRARYARAGRPGQRRTPTTLLNR